PSASFALAIASEYFFAFSASEASLSGFARSLLTVFFFFSSAADAGWPASSAVAPTIAAMTAASPTTGRTAVLFAFMMLFRIVKPLIPELRGVHKSDSFHAVALRRGQHLRHVVVLRATVGTQMDFGLRLLVGLLAEITLQLIQVLHHGAVPHD